MNVTKIQPVINSIHLNVDGTEIASVRVDDKLEIERGQFTTDFPDDGDGCTSLADLYTERPIYTFRRNGEAVVITRAYRLTLHEHDGAAVFDINSSDLINDHCAMCRDFR